jgi:hypothetical protein
MAESDGIVVDNIFVETSGTTPTLEGLMGEWDYFNGPALGFGPGSEDDGNG